MSSKDTAIMRALIALLQGTAREKAAAARRLKQELGEDYGDGPW